MNWLRNLMRGRSGSDQLSIFLLALSVVLSWTGRLADISFLSMIGYVVLLMGFFRMLSKNVAKRRMENRQFLQIAKPYGDKLNELILRLKGTKTHAYFRCPKCKKLLRVPKGKGRVEVTCPVCKMKSIRKV
mgnify:CR=1 FL=1